jgi:protein PhnA
MSVENSLIQRSGSKCELCASADSLTVYDVTPNSGPHPDTSVLVCGHCLEQIENPAISLASHWYCLKESMWSEHLAVQVMAYRLLHRIAEPWAQDLLSQLYLDEKAQQWADAGISDESTPAAKVVDSNGTVLQEGDTVTLIKDLTVKGAGFTAKRGTIVKNIGLTDDPKLVEGKINGIQIVLVAAYLKKA